MTKFRSNKACRALLGVALLALSGCVQRSGVPRDGALAPDLAYAYIPLHQSRMFFIEGDAGAVAIGGGVAVTAAHADKLVPPELVIGVSHDLDLMFFRTDRDKAVLAIDTPKIGEKVEAIAQYDGAGYHALGTVTDLSALVVARCEGCAVQHSFVFEGNAGPGYSGGPVTDAESGKLLGIVFGYLDRDEGKRLIYAYPMAAVYAELEKLKTAAR